MLRLLTEQRLEQLHELQTTEAQLPLNQLGDLALDFSIYHYFRWRTDQAREFEKKQQQQEELAECQEKLLEQAAQQKQDPISAASVTTGTTESSAVCSDKVSNKDEHHDQAHEDAHIVGDSGEKGSSKPSSTNDDKETEITDIDGDTSGSFDDRNNASATSVDSLNVSPAEFASHAETADSIDTMQLDSYETANAVTDVSISSLATSNKELFPLNNDEFKKLPGNDTAASLLPQSEREVVDLSSSLAVQDMDCSTDAMKEDVLNNDVSVPLPRAAAPSIDADDTGLTAFTTHDEGKTVNEEYRVLVENVDGAAVHKDGDVSTMLQALNGDNGNVINNGVGGVHLSRMYEKVLKVLAEEFPHVAILYENQEEKCRAALPEVHKRFVHYPLLLQELELVYSLSRNASFSGGSAINGIGVRVGAPPLQAPHLVTAGRNREMRESQRAERKDDDSNETGIVDNTTNHVLTRQRRKELKRMSHSKRQDKGRKESVKTMNKEDRNGDEDENEGSMSEKKKRRTTRNSSRKDYLAKRSNDDSEAVSVTLSDEDSSNSKKKSSPSSSRKQKAKDTISDIEKSDVDDEAYDAETDDRNEDEPPKKKRGRPKKSDSKLKDRTPEEAKKRGRKRKKPIETDNESGIPKRKYKRRFEDVPLEWMQIPFEERMQQLEEFFKQHGHSRMNPAHNESLHFWVERIRYSFRKSLIYPERLEKTPALPFDLNHERMEKLTNIGFKFKLYSERKNKKASTVGTDQTEDDDDDEDETETTVRKRGRKKKKKSVTTSVATVKPRKPFENVPDEWINIPFEERLQELEHHIKGFGHSRVQAKYNQSLAFWVEKVRYSYRKTERKPEILDFVPDRSFDLNHERVDKLKNIGFEFKLFKERKLQSWDDWFAELIHYKELHGHCNVPSHRRFHFPLAEWLRAQRYDFRHKENFTQTARFKKLDELGVNWCPPNSVKFSFEERLEACRNFRRKNGHLNITTMSVTELRKKRAAMKKADDAIDTEEYQLWSLEMWALKCRREYVRFHEGVQSYLDRRKIRQLDELGFVWENPDDDVTQKAAAARPIVRKLPSCRRRTFTVSDFDEMFEQLQKIYDEFGDCNDPLNINKYFFNLDHPNCRIWRRDLLAWIKLQRDTFIIGTMSLEHRTLLESIQFQFIVTEQKPLPRFRPSRKKRPAVTGNTTDNGNSSSGEEQSSQQQQSRQDPNLTAPRRSQLAPDVHDQSNQQQRNQNTNANSGGSQHQNFFNHEHNSHPHGRRSGGSYNYQSGYNYENVAAGTTDDYNEDYESLGSDDEYNYR